MGPLTRVTWRTEVSYQQGYHTTFCPIAPIIMELWVCEIWPPEQLSPSGTSFSESGLPVAARRLCSAALSQSSTARSPSMLWAPVARDA